MKDVILLSLIGAWIVLAWTCAIRARWIQRPLLEAAAVIISVLIISFGAWRIAFPQEQLDFDTWAELSRFRRNDTSMLIKQHRPLQYMLEYEIVTAARWITTDYRKSRVCLCILSLIATLAVMIRMRRELFCSGRIDYPLLAFFSFVLSSGGNFMIDSWNDHLPLAPFYIAGVAYLMRARGRPCQALSRAFLVFLGESLLHSAEPWLWAVAAAAFLFPVRRNVNRRLKPALVFLLSAALLSACILALFPGGFSRAGGYLKSYAASGLSVQQLRLFAYGFAGGAVADVRARILLPLLLIVLGVLAADAFRRNAIRQRILLILFLSAILFPLVYETSNYERYWTIALLWPVVALNQWRAYSGSRRRGLRIYVIRAMLLPLMFAAGICVSAPTNFARRNQVNEYNLYGQRLSKQFKAEDLLLLSPDSRTGSFYLWALYYFPGQVQQSGKESEIAVETIHKDTFYVMSRTQPEVQGAVAHLVFARADDPATRIYSISRLNQAKR